MKCLNVLINVTKDAQWMYLAKTDVSVIECAPVKIEQQKNVWHVQKKSFVFLST